MGASRRQAVPPPSLDEFVCGPGLALVEFWAGWSGASFLVGVAVDRVLRHRADLQLRVARVDGDASPDICARFHVPCPPVLLLFSAGEIIGRHHGLITADALSEWLDYSLSLASQPQEEEDPS